LARRAVFVTDTLPPEARSLLSYFEVFESKVGDDALARCNALICWPSRAKKDVLRKMKNLKMIQTLTAGVDTLDFRSLPPGVRVFSNAGAYTDTVAEHAWGILLGIAKGIHIRGQKTIPRSLRNKTLLVLGCGAIGSEVARLSKSLKMTTVGVSRSFKSPELFDKRRPLSALPDLIGRADAIVVTLPLTKGTRRVLGYDLLERTKEAVILVNVGRGEIIQEEGLLRWLKERPESRFATDVYWVKEGRESFSTKAWELPNFAGTLHVSGLPLGEDLSRAKVAAALNVKLFFERGAAMNQIDVREYLCGKPNSAPIALNTRLAGRAE
jgi:D-3-phosphoglycerate dehydrogenase